MTAATPAVHTGSSPITRGRRRNVGVNLTSLVVLVVVAVIMLTPFVFMLSTSVNAAANTTIPFPPQIIPRKFSLGAYSYTFDNLNVLRLYANTILVAGVDIILSLCSAMLAGYALAKIRPAGSKIFLAVLLVTMMIPSEATLIPNFLTFNRLRLLDTYWALWLPSMAYPFGVFLVRQYMYALPTAMRDAARLDGANDWQILLRVYLPLSKGLIATLVILQFLGNWNAYLWPLIVINSPQKYTIQLGLASFSQVIGAQSYSSPSINMAATVLSLVPILIVYLVFQRHIVTNVAASSVKG